MLLNYIPDFLREIVEFKKLFCSLEYELNLLDSFYSQIFDGQFIFLCNEEFLSKFEKILNIENLKNKSIQERRKKIIIKFNEKLPYTFFRFNESLDFICGKNNYFSFIIYDKYRLVLRVKTESDDDFKEVLNLIDRMVPANLLTSVFRFNTHEIVGRFKHKDLHKYTHFQVYYCILKTD